MLDINLFRTALDKIIESEEKRFKDPSIANKVLEYDKKWRETLGEIESLRQQKNEISKNIGKYKKSGDEDKAKEAIEKSVEIKTRIDKLEISKNEFYEQREKIRYKVGNILHESVPIGEDETSNKIERVVGTQPQFDFEPISHVELVEKLKLVNTKKASEIAGSRFFYLRGDLVLLNLALLCFALDIVIEKGYTPIWTPYFMKYEMMKAAAELGDFEEQLYKIQDEDLYMIATSEQPLAAYHYDEIINQEELPFKYAGISSCFRREAGSHGKDTLGIFRVHRFEKIEQFIFCKPNESWKFHNELISNAEEIYQKLKLPYRIVNIASGELNDNAAKKYDLEAWFPSSNTYRELVSCSNCLDYQARKLKIRMGRAGTSEEKQTLHTLNSTAIATERTICCLLENYQNEDSSITIPSVLRKYMNNKTVINLNT